MNLDTLTIDTEFNVFSLRDLELRAEIKVNQTVDKITINGTITEYVERFYHARYNISIISYLNGFVKWS